MKLRSRLSMRSRGIITLVVAALLIAAIGSGAAIYYIAYAYAD
ncbi:protein of unknown function (plasmid) [Caballeronia sp. S22]